MSNQVSALDGAGEKFRRRDPLIGAFQRKQPPSWAGKVARIWIVAREHLIGANAQHDLAWGGRSAAFEVTGAWWEIPIIITAKCS